MCRRGSRGGIWGFIPPPPPLNFLEVKIIKNVKKILEVNGEKRLALKCSQEIRTETSISNFNLKGDLVGKIYVWGDMFRIIHVKGDVFRIIHRKMYSWWGYLGGDMFCIIYAESSVFPDRFHRNYVMEINAAYICLRPYLGWGRRHRGA